MITVAAANSLASSKAQADFVCDGVDDQAEINAAITALGGSPGTVFLYDGDYNLGATTSTASIVFDRSNVTLTGESRNTHLTLQDHANVNMIRSVGDGIHDIRISNLSFYGNSAHNSSGGIDINGIDTRFEHDIIRMISDGATLNHDIWVTNIYAGDANRLCVMLGGTDMHVRDSEFGDAASDVVEVLYGTGSDITNNIAHIRGTTGYVFGSDQASGVSIRGNTTHVYDGGIVTQAVHRTWGGHYYNLITGNTILVEPGGLVNHAVEANGYLNLITANLFVAPGNGDVGRMDILVNGGSSIVSNFLVNTDITSATTAPGFNIFIDGNNGVNVGIPFSNPDIVLGTNGFFPSVADSSDHVITGTAASENLTGGAGFDTIYGLDGNDNIVGGRNTDRLYGNEGNDSLNGGLGNDIMYGGSGDDTYFVDSSGDQVIEFASEGTDTVQSTFTTYKLPVNVERLIFNGDYNHIGTGNALANLIYGREGVDLFNGLSGNDSIYGNGGNDTLNGADGQDDIYGGSGNDILIGGSGYDILRGGADNDIYYVDDVQDQVIELANEGIDLVYSDISTYTLSANVENLEFRTNAAITATGNTEINHITGSIGSDSLNGLEGADTLIGRGGNDTYYVDESGDTIIENIAEGYDTVRSSATIYSLSVNVEKLIFTTTAANTGTGNASDNELIGNTGNDILDGGEGADTLRGGLGDDTYIVTDGNDTLVELNNQGIDTVDTSLMSYTLGNNFENLTFSTGTDHTGIGNNVANTITGNSGNDTLDGAGGIDQLIGGAGNDTYYIDNSDDQITENNNEGDDSVVVNLATYTLGANVENLSFAFNGAVVGVGNALLNHLSGTNFADNLDGLGGADILTGGDGDDTYFVDDSADEVVELTNAGHDTVYSSTGIYTLSNNVEDLSFFGTGSNIGTGNTSDNALTGNSASDTLYGMDGADILDGGAQADLLVGGTGDDTYLVDDVGDAITENTNEGYDTVLSNANNYVLSDNVEKLVFTSIGSNTGKGNAVDNELIGNTGDDSLEGSGGADTLRGGLGDDTYIVSDENDTLVELNNQGADTVLTSLTSFTLTTNFENLTFTSGAGSFGFGNSAANTLTGNIGNDSLDGAAGADSLIGGAGDDTYYVDNVSDQITENTAEGQDKVVANLSTFTLTANVENLSFTFNGAVEGTGNAGQNQITGSTFGDILNGLGGADALIGGDGDDIYIVDDVGDQTTENAHNGYDTVEVSANTFTLSDNVEKLVFTTSASNTGTGNADANLLMGNASSDTLYGLDGTDTLNGGAGIDILVGGDGDDIYVVDDSADAVTELANQGYDTVQSSANSYTLSDNIEKLVFTSTGSNTGTGNAGDNLLIGNTGNDTLTGGVGTDTLQGDYGDDTYVITDANDTIIESAGGGADTVATSLSNFTLIADVENLTFTSLVNATGTGNSANNIMTGNGGIDTLYGLSGDDTLYGLAGNDTLFGGNDNDTLIGGVGADVLNGGSGIDTASYMNASAAVRYSLSSVNTQGEAVGDTTVSIENLTGSNFGDQLVGDAGNNVLSGLDGDDVLYGLDGDDTVLGGNGNDLLDGGAGNNNYYGGAGFDTVSFTTRTSGINLDMAAPSALPGQVTGVFDSIERIFGSQFNDIIRATDGGEQIRGLGGDDMIYGRGSDDIISGDQGNDTIQGDGGNDLLYGDAGSDVFVFSVQGGSDYIADFDSNPVGGQDYLDLRALGIDGNNFQQSITSGLLVLAASGASDTLLTVNDAGGVVKAVLHNVTVASLDGTDFLT
jgi:serralysin